MAEEAVCAIVRGGSPGGRSETLGVGFVKKVGFKLGVRTFSIVQQGRREGMGVME